MPQTMLERAAQRAAVLLARTGDPEANGLAALIEDLTSHDWGTVAETMLAPYVDDDGDDDSAVNAPLDVLRDALAAELKGAFEAGSRATLANAIEVTPSTVLFVSYPGTGEGLTPEKRERVVREVQDYVTTLATRLTVTLGFTPKIVVVPDGTGIQAIRSPTPVLPWFRMEGDGIAESAFGQFASPAHAAQDWAIHSGGPRVWVWPCDEHGEPMKRPDTATQFEVRPPFEIAEDAP